MKGNKRDFRPGSRCPSYALLSSWICSCAVLRSRNSKSRVTSDQGGLQAGRTRCEPALVEHLLACAPDRSRPEPCSRTVRGFRETSNAWVCSAWSCAVASLADGIMEGDWCWTVVSLADSDLNTTWCWTVASFAHRPLAIVWCSWASLLASCILDATLVVSNCCGVVRREKSCS